MEKIGSVVEPVEGGIPIATGTPKPEAVTAGKPEVIAGYDTFDPASIGSTGGDSSGSDTGSSGTGKRRGRPKGSKNAGTGSTQAAKNSKSLEGLENILLSIHMMGAGFLQCPELVIEPKEAEKMTAAIQRVAEFYPIGFTDKQMAWANLIFVLATIEGTRIVAIWQRLQKQESKPKARVIPIEQFPKPQTAQAETEQKVNGVAQPIRTTSGEPKITNPSQIFGNIVSDAGEEI